MVLVSNLLVLLEERGRDPEPKVILLISILSVALPYYVAYSAYYYYERRYVYLYRLASVLLRIIFELDEYTIAFILR